MTKLERRDALVLAHMQHVRFMARDLKRKLPFTVDDEDLYQAGLAALIPAADRFEPSRGKKFWTFANFCVRGAMLDYLRLIDGAPRTTRRLQKAAEKFLGSYRHKFGRNPTDAEIAEKLEIPVERWLKWKPTVSSFALSPTRHEQEEDEPECQFMDHKPLQDDRAQMAEIRTHLKTALAKLPPRHREVVTQYFFYDRTLKEAGKNLGIAESRASQIKTAALERMREDLAKSGISLDMFLEK